MVIVLWMDRMEYLPNHSLLNVGKYTIFPHIWWDKMDKQQQQPKKIMSGKHRLRFLKKEMGRGLWETYIKTNGWLGSNLETQRFVRKSLSPPIAMDDRMAMDFSLQAQAR